MSTATRMTAEEYFAVSVERDWTELVDGVMVVDEPMLLHNLAQTRIVTELANWTDAAPNRGFVSTPSSILVDRHNVFSPDVLWISEEHLPKRFDERLDAVPDLAVEIRSPSTWRYDVGKKKATYERGGLPELWLVDTAAWSVLVFRRSSKAASAFDVELELSRSDRITSPQLPGFSLAVERLFVR
ncbi:MAG: Uma2 family endonuclease [Thermoleophilaceae bacterium]